MSETTPPDELTAETIEKLDQLRADSAPVLPPFEAVGRDVLSRGRYVVGSSNSPSMVRYLAALLNAAPALIASARLAAERGERIRVLEDVAESVLRHINEMMDECPFCDMPDEQHDPDCRCGALESALGKGEP